MREEWFDRLRDTREHHAERVQDRDLHAQRRRRRLRHDTDERVRARQYEQGGQVVDVEACLRPSGVARPATTDALPKGYPQIPTQTGIAGGDAALTY